MLTMRSWFVLRALCGFALGYLTLANLPAYAADVAAGKEKAELCIGCHGERGISQIENIPSLAGQSDQFIQWQLVFFRAGTRKNEQMQPIVEQINNDDIRNLGAYFASLTPPKCEIAPNRDPTRNWMCAVDYLYLSTFSLGSWLDAKHDPVNFNFSQRDHWTGGLQGWGQSWERFYRAALRADRRDGLPVVSDRRAFPDRAWARQSAEH
jgi:cytochrome c553